AAYFEQYVDHFGFRKHIAFETGVKRARRDGDGWDIELESGEHRRFDALLVANGHHWDPRWPEPPFPGTFAGRQMHSHDYKD
ncbi:monooxygenase, partial [Pseudomonas sp. GP01-A4]